MVRSRCSERQAGWCWRRRFEVEGEGEGEVEGEGSEKNEVGCLLTFGRVCGGAAASNAE